MGFYVVYESHGGQVLYLKVCHKQGPTCALPLETPPESCLTEPTDLVQLPATSAYGQHHESMHTPLKLVLQFPNRSASFYGHHTYFTIGSFQTCRKPASRVIEIEIDPRTHAPTLMKKTANISLEYCTPPRHVSGTWDIRSTPGHDIWPFSRHVLLKLSCHGLHGDLLLLCPLQETNVGF